MRKLLILTSRGLFFIVSVAACGAENANVEPQAPPPGAKAEQERSSEFESAVRAANAAPNDLGVQISAVERGERYLSQAAWNQHSDPKAVERLGAISERVLASAAPCEGKKKVLTAYLAGQRSDVVIDLAAGRLQECILPTDMPAVTTAYVDAKRCDELAKLAETVYARSKSSDDKVKVLDSVEKCSTPFDRRTHFAFVPPAVMIDYDALKGHRQMQVAQERAADDTKKASERCEERCMTNYAENGICMKGCRGQIRCIESCRLAGDQCNRDCH